MAPTATTHHRADLAPNRKAITVHLVTETTSKPTVALHNVTIQFESTPLLSGVSVGANPGEVVGIQGPNGSGKTSLLRIIANIASPAGGSRIGPQSCAYVPSTIDPLPLRASDWLRHFPRGQRRDPRPVLQELNFDSDLSKKLPELSFGNLRKLLLVEAFTSGEPLLVIDELTAGLDRRGSAAASGVLNRLARTGTTVVISDQENRPLPTNARALEINGQSLIEVANRSFDEQVEITLRGPRSKIAELTQSAGTFGFRPS